MDLAIDFKRLIYRDGMFMSYADQTSTMLEFPDLESPAIIAVMGLPYTEMDSVCRMVSEWVGGSVYNTKGVLDVLSHEQGYTSDHPPTNEDEAMRLHRVSFDVVCQMAGYMYSWLGIYGRVRCLLISSTCSDYKRQMDKLVAISYVYDEIHCQPLGPILIIECRRRNWFRWKEDVEQRMENYTPWKWYEPTSWKDVETVAVRELHRSNDEHFLTLARKDYRLRKLLVDPLEDISYHMSPPGEEILPGYSLLLSEAIKHLLSCDVLENPVVEYSTWRRQHLERLSPTSRVTTLDYLCMPGDCIFRFTNNLQNVGAICYVCDQEVVMNKRGYYCQFCSLSFHESCAANIVIPPRHYQVIDSFLKQNRSHACYTCLEKGEGFSKDCGFCVFRAIVKSRLLPIVMRHVRDDHTLSFRYYTCITNLLSDFYKCKACGHQGYLSSYGCNICKSQFHLHCLKLPLQTKSVATQHGGHEHDIKIEFSCVKQDEEEYEWCLICGADIDPQIWVYTCRDCDFVVHTDCLYPQSYDDLLLLYG